MNQDPIRVLLVEDNPVDSMLVEDELAHSTDARFSVVHVERLTDALALLQGEHFDVVLLDLSLPDSQGFDTFVRFHEAASTIPIVVLSGRADGQLAIQSVQAGAQDYLVKGRLGEDVLPRSIRYAIERQRSERSLAESDERYRLLIQQSPNGYLVHCEGKIVFCNAAALKLLGAERPEQLLGRPYLESISPEFHDVVSQRVLKAEGEGSNPPIEVLCVRLDGTTVAVEGTSNPFVHQGKPAVQAVLHDLTERKRTERKIVEQAALLDEARDAICVMDLDQHILFWNKSAERLYGWSALEALGQNANDLLRQGDVALTGLKTLIQHGEWLGELRQTTRTCRQLIVESRWTLIRDAMGAPKSILVINTDVTQRKKVEEKVREQADLLNKASDAILVCDLDQQIVYWNEGARRLYGWSAKEAIGKSAERLFFKEKPANFAEIGKAVVSRGEWMGELLHVTHGEGEVTVESRQTLVRDDEGKATSVLHINSNITERKRLEAQFLRVQRLENLGALAGGIAHDLNNVLAPIMMAVGLIQANPSDVGNLPLLETIGGAAQRGSDLVKQILSFARGTDGDKVALKLGKVISEVVNLARVTFPRSISVVTQIAPDLPLIHGDETQLHQVILNLCVNARDAMPEGGPLLIEAAETTLEQRRTLFCHDTFSGRFIELKVDDAGTGMPAEIQAKIFEPFFTTKEPGKGTGLGLSTVLNIVKAHGGFLEVSSEPGLGTIFHIFLPVPEVTATPQALGQTDIADGRGECILVVDDEAAIVEITSAMLAASGYRVFSASDGAEAVNIFTQHHAEIDLVITDLNMPTMGGTRLVGALREIEPAIRIIVVSGLPAERAGLPEKSDANAYLKKPYTMATLLSSIRSTLERN